ncbi:hypothetical protein EV2_039565 [Malus domestica]
MGGDSFRFPGWGSTHSCGNSSGSPFYSQSFLEHEWRNNNVSAPNLCRCGQNGLFGAAQSSWPFPPFGVPYTPDLSLSLSPIAGFWMFVPFSSTCIPAFASASTPAFGATGFAPFARTTSPMFGSRGDGSYGGSFGASNTPAFGSSSSTVGTSSNQAFGASSTTGFGSFSSTQPLSSSPTSAFAQSSSRFSSSPFGASSPFGSQCFPFVGQSTTIGNTRQSAFGGQQHNGSSVASYTATLAVDDSRKVESISAMSVYKDKSHEELRVEDYKLGKGVQFPAGGSTIDISTSQPNRLHPAPSLLQPSSSPFSTSTSSNISAPETPSFTSQGIVFTPPSPSVFRQTSSLSPLSSSTSSGFSCLAPAQTSNSAPPAMQICIGRSATPFGQKNTPFRSSSEASSTSNPIAFGQATPLFVSSQPLQSSGSVFNIVSQNQQGNPGGSTGILGQNGFESFSSTPAFGQLSYMSGCCQLCASCGAQSTTGNIALGKPVSEGRHQGSGVPTTVTNTAYGEPDEKIHSISSMPIYGDRSHEEMRWQNYQLGDKGGPALGGVTHFHLLTKKPAPTFAQTSLSLSNTSTVSNISAPQNPSITAAGFGASSTPNLFASSSSTASLFGPIPSPSFSSSSAAPASTFAFPSPAPATTSTCNHGLFGCMPSVAQTGLFFFVFLFMVIGAQSKQANED